VLAATLLPSRPGRDASADGEPTDVVSVEGEPVMRADS
jgi:hypothetical protein